MGVEPEDQIDKATSFTAIASEASGFYTTIITVSSSFLGGSLVFIEKFAPSSSRSWEALLYAGWIFLILSMFGIIWVRLNNIKSGTLALRDDYHESSKLDNKKELATQASAYFSILGISFIVLFGMVNLTRQNNIREDTMNEKKKRPDEVHNSIPFADTVSQAVRNKPAEKPQETASNATNQSPQTAK